MDCSWCIRGDVFYTDKYHLSTPDLDEAPTAADVSLPSAIRNDRYTLEAFITNLLEEKAPVSVRAEMMCALRTGHG